MRSPTTRPPAARRPSGQAAEGDDPRIARFAVAEQALADDRAQAVGADDQRGTRFGAVGEPQGPVVGIEETRTEAQALVAQAGEQRRMQVAAVDGDERRAVARRDRIRLELGEHRAVGAPQGPSPRCTPGASATSPSPSARSARTPFGQIDSPAPSGRISSAASWTSTSSPARRSAIPAARPPIPPPITVALRVARLIRPPARRPAASARHRPCG